MDGKFIALGALEPKFWANFCKKMGREDLLEKRLLPYEEENEATDELKRLFASKTQTERIEIFGNEDVVLARF